MFRRLAPLALSALAMAGLSSLAGAQMCPNTCTASYQTNTTGSFQPGDVVTLVPTSLTDATSALLGVIGGGFVCNTCTPCSVFIAVSWSITSTNCVSYNNCGPLQDPGPGSGSANTTLYRNCNDAPLNLRLDYGTCSAGGGCPVVSSAAWTLTSALTCGNCN
jgi:hypothetical protein